MAKTNLNNVRMLLKIFRTFKAVIGLIGALYALSCGITNDAITKIYDVRRWLKRLAFINLFFIAMAIATIHWKSESFALFAVIMSTVSLIISWYLGNVVSKTLGAVKNDSAKAIATEVEKLIRPLLTVALIIAFIGVYVTIYGVAALNVKTLMVIVATTVFFAAFVIYLGNSTKFVGWLLAGLVCFMLAQYSFPEQFEAGRHYFSGKNEKIMAESHRTGFADQADARVTYAVVVRENVLYKIKGFKYKKAEYDTLKPGHKVMVIEIKKDLPKEGDIDWTGEPLARIMLTNAHRNFMKGNDEFYFPVSALSDFKVVSDFRQVRMPEKYTSYMGTGFFTKEVKPITDGQPEVFARVYNGSEFIYSSEGEFVVVENPGTNQAKIGEVRPKCEPGKEKSFMFINQPPEGSVIALMPVNSTNTFNVRYKIKM